ncbi:MAG: tetratricopeptide repeat protein [Blastocatellales bacterium]
MSCQPAFLHRAFLQAIFLFAILSVCSATSIAQGGAGGGNSNNPSRSGGVSHTIRGKVFLPSGNLPDQRMRVVLELSTGGVVSEVFSDSAGNFEFRLLPNGTYRVVVPPDGRNHETSQETVELYGNFTRIFTTQVYLKEKGEGISIKTKEKTISAADLQQVPKDAKKKYDNGLKLARENKPGEAVALFQQAIRIFPEYLAAINKLGEQFRALDKLAEAQAAFEKAIAINPKYSLPHINLGMLLVDQKRYDEGIASLETGNKLDDSFPMSHLRLGEAFMSKQPPDYDRAEKELTRALELGNRDFLQVRKHLFNLNLRRQRLDKAVEQLEAYLKEAPDAPDAEAVRETLGKVKKMMAQQKATTKN